MREHLKCCLREGREGLNCHGDINAAGGIGEWKEEKTGRDRLTALETEGRECVISEQRSAKYQTAEESLAMSE